ncbi:helix-turn-helix domain-containing protein [Thiorhodococcus minor]|uniref:Helix-turn-helix domain-containing protein n=2 Tax=Thiorhodococcus minor TaxID=57489 RepID=A0A6M0K4V7_9GAMM|nr:helix-turn-helix domain-containing protein [Thiorhodococcus minor]
MKAPLFIRPLTASERQALAAGLSSPDAFTQRRCKILLANVAGKTAPKIAASLGCAQQTVLNALNAFEREGLGCLVEKSHRTKKTRRPLIQGHSAEKICSILRRDPREFGKPHRRWTYAAVAEVAFEQGLSERAVSEETIRQVILRLGLDWKQARAGVVLRARSDALRQSAVAC